MGLEERVEGKGFERRVKSPKWSLYTPTSDLVGNHHITIVVLRHARHFNVVLIHLRQE